MTASSNVSSPATVATAPEVDDNDAGEEGDEEADDSAPASNGPASASASEPRSEKKKKGKKKKGKKGRDTGAPPVAQGSAPTSADGSTVLLSPDFVAAAQAAAAKIEYSSARASSAPSEPATAETSTPLSASSAAAPPAPPRASDSGAESGIGRSRTPSGRYFIEADGRLSPRSPSGRLDIGGDDEASSWFAAGDDAADLANRQAEHHSAQPFAHGKHNRLAIGITVAIAVLFLAVVILGPGDDEEEGEEAAVEEQGDDDAEVREERPSAGTGETARSNPPATPDAGSEPPAQRAEPARPDALALGAPADAGGIEPHDVANSQAEPEQVAVAVPGPDAARSSAVPDLESAPEPPREPPPREPSPPTTERAQPDASRTTEREADAGSSGGGDDARQQARELSQRGLSALRSNDLESARALLAEAISLDSGLAEAHAGLGDVYFAQRDFQRAVTSHRRATQLSRSNSEYHRKLGMDYFRLENYASALESCQRAMDLGDDQAERCVQLAQERLQSAP